MTSMIDVTVWGLFIAMIGDAFGLFAVGWFGQAYALLFLPVSLLNQSSTNIFYPRLARARGDRNALYAIVKRMLNLSFDLGFYPLLALIVISPQLWALLLGESFYMSGELAQPLIPLAFITMIYSPVSVAINVFHRQRAFFLQSVVLNTFRLGVVYWACWEMDLKTQLEPQSHLYLVVGSYTAVTVIFRLAQLLWILRLMDVKVRGLISGLFIKSCYTLTALLMITVLYMVFNLQLFILICLTVLGGLGWLALVVKHNTDVRIFVQRLRS